jgi:geranylgeranyl diphosphate synthase, type I
MTSAAGVPHFLTIHRESIESALKSAIGDGSSPLVAASRYVLGWEDEHGSPASNEGKRIRPALCLFAAEAVGGSASSAIPGAVAVELVHNFSLVHDEVQDHDAERHHRPTVWALLGEGQAINVGDFLFTRAIRALTEAPGAAGPRLAALSVLMRAIESMVAGQWDDIAFESRERVSVEEYIAMSARKTGALLSAPLEVGALLAGASREQASTIGQWGLEVGLAFQAHDDYLGIWGNPDRTGKSNTNDIARRKKTLPVVHALQHPAAANIVVAAYTRDVVTDNEVAQVVAALEAVGSDRQCREQARRHADEADRLLSTIELSVETRSRFRAVAAYLVDRDF